MSLLGTPLRVIHIDENFSGAMYMRANLNRLIHQISHVKNSYAFSVDKENLMLSRGIIKISFQHRMTTQKNVSHWIMKTEIMFLSSFGRCLKKYQSKYQSRYQLTLIFKLI